MRLGRYPDIKLAAAREKAREARGEIGEGTDPLVEKRAREVSQTVSDLIENYVTRHAVTKRTGPAIARRLRYNVTSQIGGIKLFDLHRRDITRCIDRIKDRGADIEANRVFEDLRAMIRWARGRGDLDENTMEGMRKPSETVERDRFLTADEIRTVWDGLPAADMRDSTRRIIQLCLVTAQRVGEVAGMSRSELDLDAKLWVIPAARSKNGLCRYLIQQSTSLPNRSLPPTDRHVARAAHLRRASFPQVAALELRWPAPRPPKRSRRLRSRSGAARLF